MPEEVLGVAGDQRGPPARKRRDRYAPALPFMPHLHDSRSQRHAGAAVHPPALRHGAGRSAVVRGAVRVPARAHADAPSSVVSRARSVPVRRAATRREILRRVLLATDFIHSNYDKPLMLGDMARAAFLSRHHFLRLFKHIHEVTPHEYLQRKRTTRRCAAAARQRACGRRDREAGGLRFALDAVPGACVVSTASRRANAGAPPKRWCSWHHAASGRRSSD